MVFRWNRLVFGVLAAVAMAAPAQAKMPGFDVRLSATSGAPGTTLSVAVVVEAFRSKGARGPSDLDGLLGLLPASDVTDVGRPAVYSRPALIDLRRTRPGRYTGAITLPAEPGNYVIIPFPQEYRASGPRPLAGYPRPITVTAAPLQPLAAPVPPPSRSWAMFAAPAAGIAVAVAGIGYRRRRD